jgi:protein phosphatase
MEYSILSDVGVKRSTNQDYAGTVTNLTGQRLFLLADGMGGHKAGNVASKLAVEDIGKAWEQTAFDVETGNDAIQQWLKTEVRAENDNISNLGKLDDYKGMGTTLEASVIFQDRLIHAHVGDSRTYLAREGELIQLTSDHSLVQELLDAGELTAEEAANHPNKNIITRSLGQGMPVEVDISITHLQAGDYVLMNSDGLTNMVSLDAIKEVLYLDTTLEAKAAELIQMANDNGGTDNITVVLNAFNGGDFL